MAPMHHRSILQWLTAFLRRINSIKWCVCVSLCFFFRCPIARHMTTGQRPNLVYLDYVRVYLISL